MIIKSTTKTIAQLNNIIDNHHRYMYSIYYYLNLFQQNEKIINLVWHFKFRFSYNSRTFSWFSRP